MASSTLIGTGTTNTTAGSVVTLVVPAYNMQFILKDKNGVLLVNMPYTATVQGSIFHGNTTSEGKTQKFLTATAQIVSVYIGFDPVHPNSNSNQLIIASSTALTPNSIQVGVTDRLATSALFLSSQGEAFIKAWEGLVLHYYNDSFNYCTAGWGHLISGQHSCQSQGIHVNTPITLAQAAAWFSQDKPRHEMLVRKAIKVPLHQREFDSLCSLAYNVGSISIKAPTLCRKINAGDYLGGNTERLDMTNNGLAGLVTRRHQESEMFLNGNYDASH